MCPPVRRAESSYSLHKEIARDVCKAMIGQRLCEERKWAAVAPPTAHQRRPQVLGHGPKHLVTLLVEARVILIKVGAPAVDALMSESSVTQRMKQQQQQQQQVCIGVRCAFRSVFLTPRPAHHFATRNFDPMRRTVVRQPAESSTSHVRIYCIICWSSRDSQTPRGPDQTADAPEWMDWCWHQPRETVDPMT